MKRLLRQICTNSVRVLQCDRANDVLMSGFLSSFKKAGGDALKSSSKLSGFPIKTSIFDSCFLKEF